MTSTETAPVDAPPPTRRARGAVLRVVSALLAVALIVLVAFSIVELRRAHDANAKEKAGTAALKAAVADFPKIASYSYATIDADMARAKSVFTPALQKDYSKIFGSLTQTLQQQKVVVTAQVQQAQTLSVDSPSEVKVMIFFTQQTSKPTAASSGVTPGTYALTMSKIKGVWLIGAANAAG